MEDNIMLINQDRIWAESGIGYDSYTSDEDEPRTIAIITPSLEQLINYATYINYTDKDNISLLGRKNCQYLDVLTYFRSLKQSNLKSLETLESSSFCQNKKLAPAFLELRFRAEDIANISKKQLAFATFSEAINHKSYLCNRDHLHLRDIHFRASEILRLSEFLDKILSTGSLSYALNINGYSKKEEILELKRCHLSVEEMEDDINRAYKKNRKYL